MLSVFLSIGTYWHNTLTIWKWILILTSLLKLNDINKLWDQKNVCFFRYTLCWSSTRTHLKFYIRISWCSRSTRWVFFLANSVTIQTPTTSSEQVSKFIFTFFFNVLNYPIFVIWVVYFVLFFFISTKQLHCSMMIY